MRAGFFESAGVAFTKEKKERRGRKASRERGREGEEGNEEMTCTNTGTAY